MSEKPTRQLGMRTEEFAQALGIKANSVRTRLCRHGSYFGVTPKRMPNGRLRWRESDLDALLNDEREVA